MSKKSGSTSSGVGCLTVFGIIFVVLKLVEVEPIASWSWWWVTAPFWGQLVIIGGLLVVAGFLAIVIKLLDLEKK